MFGATLLDAVEVGEDLSVDDFDVANGGRSASIVVGTGDEM